MLSYDEILSRMESAYKEKTDAIPDETSDTGIRLLCYTSVNQHFNLLELSFLSTDCPPN